MSNNIENWYWNIDSNNQFWESLKWIESKVKQEQRTILYLAYLTTLARLPENRDLDELFDWEIQLWEEEMFSVFSLIEIINWSNSIDNLKPPKEMTLDWNWAQDYSYKIDYEEYYYLNWQYYKEWDKNLVNIDKSKLKKKRVVKSLTWDWNLPFNETKLIFNYDQFLNITWFNFERPTNMNEWWVWINQEIKFTRNSKWLVEKMRILRDYELDNELIITYNNLWKPEIVEQSKLWLLSDKIVFEYDDNWNLTAIIYVPTLSLKHIKWLKQAYKSWKSIRWVVKWVKMAWEYIAFEVLKKMKWNDVIRINNQNWLPISTESSLGASRWTYNKWFSKMKYWWNMELQELYLEMEEIWPDDEKIIKLKY